MMAEYKLVSVKDSELNPGDQIAVSCGIFGISAYYHHGIFISHRNGVIDLVGVPLDTRGVVEYKSISDFKAVGGEQLFILKRRLGMLRGTGSDQIYRVDYKSHRTAEDVVMTAKAELQNPIRWRTYNLKTCNCEHFASFCKIGHAQSVQISSREKSASGRYIVDIASGALVSSGSSTSSSSH
ncbi:uncharacterized protein LOC141911272 [Tubulanus polymorphus]|uniref:uncharacterized protein LOC141911272 n=1 Tax=Tubulanus polymorphus TaxID=672921 RepID=UPI003DA2D5E5